MTTPAPIAEIPWNIEPTGEAILAEAKRLQISTESAREKLIAKMTTAALRLNVSIPSAAARISAAQAEAEAAGERAVAVATEHQENIDAITGGLLRIGDLKLQAKTLRELAMPKGDAHAAGRAVLEAWLDARSAPSPFTETKYRALLEDFTFRQAVNPHIESFAGEFDAQAASVVAEIKGLAKDAGVNVGKLIESLVAEGRIPEFLKYRHANAFEGLYQ